MRLIAAMILLACLSFPAAAAVRCTPTNSGLMICGQASQRIPSHPRASRSGRIVAHPKGCPRVAFCGCGVSVWAYGHSVRSLWLARAYYRFPRARPAKGNVAIYGRHHVAGIIKSYGDGTALLYDPNSGHHKTRIHRRSIKGAVIVNPHAEMVARR